MPDDIETICRESAIRAAVQAERHRIAAILTLEIARDRQQTAKALALLTDVPANLAGELLLCIEPDLPVRASGRPDLKLVTHAKLD